MSRIALCRGVMLDLVETLVKIGQELEQEDVSFHRLDSETSRKLNGLQEKCKCLINTLGEQYCDQVQRLNWKPVTDPSAQFASSALDVIETMAEKVDNLLDEHRGRLHPGKHQQPAVSERKKRPRLEVNDEAAAKPEDWQIFVAEEHPYAELLKDLTYPDWVTATPEDEPAPPAPLEETPCHWIETAEQLEHMVGALRCEPLLAIDLEHHSMHSYHGIVCLMQISTRSADYLIDTIKLRRELGPALRPVLADPRHLKVFHGAESDILWLQRDFGLWVVGMFDTYFACRALGLARHSLAYLLEHYLGLTIDKQYQMADWRQRPLPAPMLLYARQDTHYLPHLFDLLQRELIKAGHLAAVLRSSASRCGLLYRPADISGDWRRLLRSSNAPLNPQEARLLESLHSWRDQVARQENVSHHAVLPDAALVRLAQCGGQYAQCLDRIRADTAMARKHLASLPPVEGKRLVEPSPMAPPKQPIHTRFPQEEPKEVASTSAPARVRRPIGFKNTCPDAVSLASMFADNQAQPKQPFDATTIVSQMPMARSIEAARELSNEVAEPEEMPNPVPKVKPKMIEPIEITHDRIVNMARPQTRKRTAEPIVPFDYEAAIQQKSQGVAELVSPDTAGAEFEESELSAIPALVNPAPVKPVPVIKEAKLSRQPRSGNRSATFKLSKK